ncbi:calcofluor white hypersensitive protein [Aureobasidium pullulans]|nr:calcofluor white hypersensitive protein [Aureobasidium pullulans]
MAPKHKDGDVVAVIPGQYISWLHTIVAYAAFLGALIVGVALHYEKIVQNEHFGYPIEWFPSVSATIGDRYPERSVFQLFIAVTSGPRFLLVALWYILTARPGQTLPKFILGVGIFRTFTCGGWTYVTSTDDHDWHDIFMISYLVATLPWTIGCIALSPNNPKAIYYRKVFGGAFFATLVPLVYFFIQHKVHKVPGAYTIYAFFEWALVLLDVAFDAVTALDFSGLELVVKDTKGTSKGSTQRVADKLAETEKDKPVGQIFSTTYSKGDMLDALADVYLGFTFWSVLTGLGLLIWYFPLWHMGISGYEAFVMAPISPFLLGITSIRRTVVHNIRLVHFLSLSGLVAFLIPKPEYRLFAVGFSIFMSSLAWSATWWSERAQPARLESRISAFSLGLLTSSVAKYACQTNNPIWPAVHAENGGWNYTGLVLAIVAILRVTRKPLDPRNDVPGYKAVSGSSFPAALGFAGLMFGMHSLLSDSSTMISWVWEGFPIRGPIAVPHGNYTFLAMGLGLLIGLYYPAFARTWTFYGIGALGAAFLTAFSHWSGFYGGLALATYLMAAAPVLIGNAARYPPGRTFFAGFLFYNILVLAHVWTVAYAFVPGGPLMREHTDWVMTAMMLFIGCGIFSATASETKRSKPAPANPYARKQRSHYIYILIGLQLLGASISYLRFPTYDYTPYHAPEKSVTAGIWTTHFGLDNPMWTSERRIGALVKEMELDVLGLLESDTQRIIMGNRDSTQYLAEELGMYVDYGPGPNKHTWGCALLSKFPIVNSTHHLLPSPVGELAPAIHATLDAYGEMIDVFVFHSGQEEDPEDRRLQSEYLADLMGSTPRPAILLSYLVTKTGQGNYNTYVSERSGMRDIDPSDDWDRWCEYILYKGLRRSGYARVSRGTITDTELQVGKFVVGQAEGGNDQISEDQVPEGLRFPAMFRGEGVRGHRYHVFDEPRYYA